MKVCLTKRKTLKKYLDICDSVNKTSNDYHIYVVFLMVSLFLYVLRSTNVVAPDIIMLRHIKDLPPIEIAYHVIAAVWTICDIILLVAVLKIINEVSLAQENVLSALLKIINEVSLAQKNVLSALLKIINEVSLAQKNVLSALLKIINEVSLAQKNVLSALLKIINEVSLAQKNVLSALLKIINEVSLAQKNVLSALLKIINEVSLAQENVLSALLKHKDEAHNTIAELVVFLKAYHSIEGTGYRVFGIPTKAMKTLLFASFVSLSAFIGGILFNESWS